MKILRRAGQIALCLAALCGGATGMARADPPVYKIGASLGLTGYAAVGDRNWRDALLLAAETLNAKGGILGHKVEIVVEDNRSQPQDAVVAYRKMISSDQVGVFDSGCVSAGNFAAASFVARAQIPMLLCSILPRLADEQKWAFSFLPPPAFEMQARYDYLLHHTQIRKIGLLTDPTPYSQLMKKLAVQIAEQDGLQIVADETYKSDDVDVNIQLGRIAAAGAGAVVKLGQGGSTVTAAKDIQQLGMTSMLLLASTDDTAIYKAAGAVLGDRFFFVGSPVQFGEDALPADAPRAQIMAFVTPWRAKYGDRDTGQASRAWDSVLMLAKAIETAKSFDGTAVRNAYENLGTYVGAGATYHFSPNQHVGITENPYLVGYFANDKPVAVK